MEPELIDRWRARITSNEVSIITPSVQYGAQFLLQARHDDEQWWGAYKSMPLDLVSSAAAIEALESCEQAEFKTDILNSRIVLTDYIRAHAGTLDLTELIAALRILARSERDDLCTLAHSLVDKIAALRNGAGWGVPIPTIPTTADVLSALASHDSSSNLVASIVRTLFEEQNEDGGWPITLGGLQSAALPSARAIFVLVSAEPTQDRRDFENATLYLRRLVESGWASLIEEGGVQLVAQVLRAAASLKSFPFDAILQGVEEVLSQRNADGAWGERRGGNSSVEATSMCVVALCAAGANRLVTSRFALSAINDSAIALSNLRKELEQMRSDVRSQVKKETKGILAENDRLNAKVIELEKEKKILVRRVEESELTQRYLSEARSDELDIKRGEVSLRTGLGFWESFWFAARRIVFDSDTWRWLLSAVAVLPLGLLASRFLFSRLGFPVETLRTLEYAVYGLAIGLLVPMLLRAFSSARLKRVSGEIGTSDRRLILRRLPVFMSDWPASIRESFLHQLSRLPTLSSDSRQAAARSIARDFAKDLDQVEQLRVLLSLLSNLPEDEQKMVLYELRNVRGRLVAS